MRFDVHSCSLSHELFSWAAECCHVPFSAGISISGVLAGVWVLVNALLVVLEVVVAGLAAVVGGDVAVALGGSRLEMGVWGTSWGELGRLGEVLDRRWGSLG